MAETTENNAAPLDFIREMVAADMKSGKYNGKVVTRFPPEPNGYLHIGHAKAICLDFGIAAENNGVCHLRFDDTNPTKEDTEYEESIQNDVRWLGFDFGKHLYYASDYFERMYECAVELIKRGKAYVCDLSAEEWDEHRATRQPWQGVARPQTLRRGEPRPFRPDARRGIRRRRQGCCAPGSTWLRQHQHARPVIYRIRRAHHFRHGDKWCIYPMYDYAHPLEDAFEGVTHSLCTLEFEIHRPLYDWVLDSLGYKFPGTGRSRPSSRG